MRDWNTCTIYSCPCFLGGCRAINLLINATIHGLHSPRVISCMISRLVGKSRSQHLAAVVFRACCFACLGLPHSCQPPPGRRRMMESEDSATQQFLDDLVVGFSTKFTELKLLLSEFLLNQWAPEMHRIQTRQMKPCPGLPTLL
ncbi:hypothetical protein BJY04DRAFT_179404, partial [Aspergillus karnatakaensis]|uniref:uncharacterized protein n=1 Tax=Aspergillus karnatakaensis TaxID=1810916 RepID=UPI003CCE35A9